MPAPTAVRSDNNDSSRDVNVYTSNDTNKHTALPPAPVKIQIELLWVQSKIGLSVAKPVRVSVSRTTFF